MANKRRGIYIIFCLCFLLINIISIFPKSVNRIALAFSDNEKSAVHFIDVGQGDSIFVELPDGKTLLIDAGPRSAGETVVEYIKDLNYSTINYLVLTHSDEDHSGGMVEVFENFEIQNVYRPFVLAKNETILPTGEDLTGRFSSNEILTVTTQVYANFIKYAYSEVYGNDKNCAVHISYDGLIVLSSSPSKPYVLEFHTPPKMSDTAINTGETDGYPTKLYAGSEAEKKNSVSPIISLELEGEKTFLFTGDATVKSEEDFLNNLNEDDKKIVSNVDVLKVGHHGSPTSSSEEFLQLVNPEMAVIMVGKDNSYGHPDAVVLERLNSIWSVSNKAHFLYRTDLNGNIVISQNMDNKLSVLLQTETGDEKATTIPQWVVYAAIAAIILFIIICIIIKIVNKKKLTKSDVDSAKRNYNKANKVFKNIAKR